MKAAPKNRVPVPVRVIVERQYVGAEKMESGFRRIAEEEIGKRIREKGFTEKTGSDFFIGINAEDGSRYECAGQADSTSSLGCAVETV